MRHCAAFAVLTMLSGCATLVSESQYPVTFDSNPRGALITIRDEVGNVYYRGKAPATLYLSASRGYFQPARYVMEANMADHYPAMSSIDADLDIWYLGNFVFGGLTGFLFFDPLTGAMWKLPEKVVVNLGEKSLSAYHNEDR